MDLRPRELVLVGAFVLGLVGLGVYPQPVLKTAAPAIKALQQITLQTNLTADSRR